MTTGLARLAQGLRERGMNVDGFVNDIPASALAEIDGLREELAEALEQLDAARKLLAMKVPFAEAFAAAWDAAGIPADADASLAEEITRMREDNKIYEAKIEELNETVIRAIKSQHRAEVLLEHRNIRFAEELGVDCRLSFEEMMQAVRKFVDTKDLLAGIRGQHMAMVFGVEQIVRYMEAEGKNAGNDSLGYALKDYAARLRRVIAKTEKS